jgi:hypothetical protein
VRISLALAVVITILYLFKAIPLPIVPVFDHASGGFGGFITCSQLSRTQWNFAYSSGVYFSPTPIYGMQYPSIHMQMVSPYCPKFTPPPYE